MDGFSANKELLILYAIFDKTRFKVSFYNTILDKNGKINAELESAVYVDAQEIIGDPQISLSTPESEKEGLVNDDERYSFLGWVSKIEHSFPSTRAEGESYIVDLNKIVVEVYDRDFYACYVKESVYTSSTSLNCFQFIEATYTDNKDSKYNISGYICQPKWDINNGYTYLTKLSGKITIPSEYNGKPVIGIKNFQFFPKA